eukprot:CAMPEP_0185037870 /NCGR_PEP_ID=MMETSP1103-20130426/32858_1 /TAXON_ID=36769 /ORGANISM="Paraphysomonas bandaiensis, Strain Caron Lab Isolate" /LENGTH=43 /DNA_ID= /DNA_START= /DNA_END= /DNA_ORIENTATION=
MILLLVLYVAVQIVAKYATDAIRNDPNWHIVDGIKNLDARTNM